MRLVVAEDNLLVRRGILAVLAEQPEHQVVAVCGSLDELLRAVDEMVPDVVLTDIRMPPTSTDEGVQAAVRLRASHPHMGVVLLSQHLDTTHALQLVADGSSRRGYLLKERVGDPEMLLRALHAVNAGESFVDPLVVDALIEARKASVASPIHRLTEREVEVLAEVASGRSNAAVGRRLFISERAVEKHINSIFMKLDLTGTDDLNRRVAAVLMYLSAVRG